MTRPVMFLRTALTEDRITKLEEAVAEIERKLGIKKSVETDEEWEKAAPQHEAPQPIRKAAKGKGR